MATLSNFSNILQNQFKFLQESSVMKVSCGHFCCWLEAWRFSGTLDQKAYNCTAPEPIRSLGSAMISNSWHIWLSENIKDVQRQGSYLIITFVPKPARILWGLNVTKMPLNSGLIAHKCSIALHVYPHLGHFALVLLLIETVCVYKSANVALCLNSKA